MAGHTIHLYIAGSVLFCWFERINYFRTTIAGILHGIFCLFSLYGSGVACPQSLDNLGGGERRTNNWLPDSFTKYRGNKEACVRVSFPVLPFRE